MVVINLSNVIIRLEYIRAVETAGVFLSKKLCCLKYLKGLKKSKLL